MLQSEVRDVITQCVEEMVPVVVMRPKELLGLIHQALVVIPHLLRSLKRSRAVGGNIHLGEWVLSEWHHFQEFSSDHRRVHKGRQRRGGEMDLISALAGDGKRCAEL